jgi:5'(3')-deoxyribonucleotidase
MKKLTIISDLDEIAAGLLVKWIGRYNADHDDDVTIDDVVTHELHAHVKIGKDIYKYIDEDGFLMISLQYLGLSRL